MKGDLRFPSLPPSLKSQAEAHYKGNRHARRVKGIEAAKTRGREPSVREPGDPAPPGSTPPNGDGVAPRPGKSSIPTPFSRPCLLHSVPTPRTPLLSSLSSSAPTPPPPKVSTAAKHSDAKFPSCHPHSRPSSSQQSPHSLSSPLPSDSERG